MKHIVYLLGLSVLAMGCGGQKNSADASKKQKTVVDYANSITSDELKTDLYIYASDEFEGRNTGSEGQKKAVNFLKDRYISLGIPSPIGGDDYFQEVPLEIMEVPKVEFAVGGNNYKAIDDFVSVSSGATGIISENEVVYAGFGIEDDGYSSYSNLDVKDKVVLIKAGEPKNEDGTYTLSGSAEASKWSNFRQEYVLKRDAAKEKGAKALLFYNPEVYGFVAQRFGRSSGRMSLQGGSDNMYYFFVNDTLAKALVNDIETSDTGKTVQQTISINYESVSKKFESENVLAFIKGTEKPDEVLVISAHLDHEGVKDGEIYNGADDDGSGSVALLELAQAFQTAAKEGNGPKRSILFLHVTAEEKGLLGSQYYTDFDPIIPLANTVVDLNIDMIGRVDPKHDSTDGNYIYLIGSDKLSTELHNISEAANAKYCNIELDYTYNDENDPNRFYYRSDHYNFAKNNIPVIFYFNGTHADYHKPTDTPDKIRYDLLESRTRLVFYTAWEIANMQHRLVVDKEFH